MSSCKERGASSSKAPRARAGGVGRGGGVHGSGLGRPSSCREPSLELRTGTEAGVRAGWRGGCAVRGRGRVLWPCVVRVRWAPLGAMEVAGGHGGRCRWRAERAAAETAWPRPRRWLATSQMCACMGTSLGLLPDRPSSSLAPRRVRPWVSFGRGCAVRAGIVPPSGCACDLGSAARCARREAHASLEICPRLVRRQSTDSLSDL